MKNSTIPVRFAPATALLHPEAEIITGATLTCSDLRQQPQ